MHPPVNGRRKTKINKTKSTYLTKPNPALRAGQQKTGKIVKQDLNIIQINTSKAKQATKDLIEFAKDLIDILVQEPYANGGGGNSKADCRCQRCGF